MHLVELCTWDSIKLYISSNFTVYLLHNRQTYKLSIVPIGLFSEFSFAGVSGSTRNMLVVIYLYPMCGIFFLPPAVSDRKMQIMVRSEYSEWFDVISGVPQGSVFGSILFLFYVNDILDTVNTNVKMFADDTKIFRILKNKSDCEILQADLDNLSEWSNRWCLTFNTSKCKRMHIKTNQNSSTP